LLSSRKRRGGTILILEARKEEELKHSTPGKKKPNCHLNTDKIPSSCKKEKEDPPAHYKNKNKGKSSHFPPK